MDDINHIYNDNNPVCQFLTPYRFDLVPKFLYATYRETKLKTNFAVDIYKEHLRVWNGFKEHNNPDKNTFEKFKECFDSLIDSMRQSGFDKNHPVPINNEGHLLNGAHRTAAAYITNSTLRTQKTSDPSAGQVDCGSSFFRNLGLDKKYLDFMALEYAKLKPHTKVITLHPARDSSKEKTVTDLIYSTVPVVYDSIVPLEKIGFTRFMSQMYLGEPWLSTSQDPIAGAKIKAALCWGSTPVRVLLIEEADLEKVNSLKADIRNIYNIGKSSVHINDTRQETLRLARVVYNPNSVHFLNNGNPDFSEKSNEVLNGYKRTLEGNNLNSDCFCVTGGAVMSLFGLQECDDLDYIHYDPNHVIKGSSHINSQEQELNRYPMHKDDILFNPNNHFYWNDIKFATLDVVKSLTDNISVLFLWKNDKRIIDELGSIGQVKQVKTVKVSDKGKYNLLDQIHYGKPWWKTNLIPETEKRIRDNEFTAYIFTGQDLHKKIKKWKYETRNKLGIDKTYFHVSDPDCYEHLGQQCDCPVSSDEYNTESIRHINMVLHKNTLDFINQRTLKDLPQFDKCLSLYHNWLPNNHANFCVDNGGVLGSYGIRDTHDIDFLCYNDDIQTNSTEFGCENKNHRLEYERLGYSIESIIDNPDNYFYHYGMKFMSLSILKKFKLNRTAVIGQGQMHLREKDRNDCELIHNFMETK